MLVISIVVSNDYLEEKIQSYDQVLLEKGIEVQKLKQRTQELKHVSFIKQEESKEVRATLANKKSMDDHASKTQRYMVY